MKAHSFFSLKTQFENVGDALINREMIRLAASCGRTYVDLSRCPEQFVQTLGIGDTATIYKGFLPLCATMFKLRLKKQPCYYFLSPGGYVGELGIKEILGKILNTLVLLIFFLLGIRICLVGVSYERLGSRNIFLQKIRLRLFYRHLVRDRTSLEYAQTCGFKTDGVMPDLAFNIFTSEPKARPDRTQPVRIAFSFRTDQYPEQKDQVMQTVEIIINTLPKTTDIAIVVQVERDREGMMELKSFIESKIGHPVLYTDGTNSIHACLEAYAICDLIISNRLHALLMGTSVAGHMIAVTGKGKNKKIEGILREIGCEDIIVPAGELSSERLGSVIKLAMSKSVNGLTQRDKLQIIFRNLLQEH